MTKQLVTFNDNIACGKGLTKDEILILLYLEHQIFLYLHTDRDIYLDGYVTMNKQKKPIFTPSFVPDWYKGPIPIELDIEKIKYLMKRNALSVHYKGRKWAPKKDKTSLCTVFKNSAGKTDYLWTEIDIQELKKRLPQNSPVVFNIGESNNIRATILWDENNPTLSVSKAEDSYSLPSKIKFTLDLVCSIRHYPEGSYFIALEFDYFYGGGCI